MLQVVHFFPRHKFSLNPSEPCLRSKEVENAPLVFSVDGDFVVSASAGDWTGWTKVEMVYDEDGGGEEE